MDSCHEKECDSAVQVVRPMSEHGARREPPSTLAQKEQVNIPIEKKQHQADRGHGDEERHSHPACAMKESKREQQTSRGEQRHQRRTQARSIVKIEFTRKMPSVQDQARPRDGAVKNVCPKQAAHRPTFQMLGGQPLVNSYLASVASQF